MPNWPSRHTIISQELRYNWKTCISGIGLLYISLKYQFSLKFHEMLLPEMMSNIFQLQGYSFFFFLWNVSSVQLLNHVQLFATTWTAACQPPCPSPTPRVYANSSPMSRWCYPTISSSVVPFSSCLQSYPASGSFQWVSSSNQVAKVLEFQLQHQSFQWTPRTDFL